MHPYLALFLGCRELERAIRRKERFKPYIVTYGQRTGRIERRMKSLPTGRSAFLALRKTLEEAAEEEAVVVVCRCAFNAAGRRTTRARRGWRLVAARQDVLWVTGLVWRGKDGRPKRLLSDGTDFSDPLDELLAY